MALKNVLTTRMETPYAKPPPLHIHVVKLEENPTVVAWDFEETVKTAIIKKNKLAIVSDGDSVTKVTLYEGFASNLEEGRNFVIRGYTLWGESPPYYLNIDKSTMFFRGSNINVPPAGGGRGPPPPCLAHD
ncbi:Alpha-13/16-mannosyltransferase ALG2 [Dissostichus eleginoides]|uniref:Alpha-13/16-mannosyltransferase ALG2 n=1 Tax=Dissostichus eleginoides TaxID=100907 RepID=A0AAD9FI62_DISEL|nr:Alpha-13/16-mannosyltransferase ALG2 [Dissostichus eleginoides]